MKAALVIVIFIFIGITAGYGYKLYQSHHAYKSQLEEEIITLKTELKDLQSLVEFQDQRIAKLEKTSINKLVDDANKMFIEGWESMLDTMESELERARENTENKSTP